MYHTHVTQYLDEHAATHPDHVAVIDGEDRLLLGSLRNQALRLAAVIVQQCPQVRQVVAVFLPKGIDAVIADVAVNYSAHAYMNLDVNSPVQRNRNIFAAIQPALVITTKALEERLRPMAGDIPVLCLEDARAALAPEAKHSLLARRDACLDTDLMCIINTSGSTGTPKGVALTHGGFMDMVQSAEQAGILDDSPKIMASLSPAIFDIYVFELCLVLMRRATLLVIPETLVAFPARMLELMVAQHATWLFWVPTVMVNIANMDLLAHIPLPEVRTVWFAGEVFPTAKCNYWRKHLPQASFVNLYGPIEISLDCAYCRLEREIPDDEPLPIGRAFPNKEILLLDAEGRQVAPGEEGEICVRGRGVAPGYYNNPEKTAAAFVQDPRNTAYPEPLYRTGDIGVFNERGELLFKGRRDTLVKCKGYRIELNEIEHVVVATGLVQNCCALYAAAEQRIVLLYESPEPVDERALRTAIARVLPRYMLPTVYRQYPALPRNANGKLDRLTLRQQFLGNTNAHA